MSLSRIPDEVIDHHIMPFLRWNDLLRFRRICKRFQNVFTGHVTVHPELAPELEINNGEKSFQNFMKMGIPTTKLFVNNKGLGHRFYEENADQIDEFLETYGAYIKTLRVNQLSFRLVANELKFLNGLVNLDNLQAEGFGSRAETENTNEFFSPQFLQLRQFHLGGDGTDLAGNLVHYIFDLLHGCLLLEHVTLPFSFSMKELPLTGIQGETLGATFELFTDHINLRHNSSGNLKTIDFQNFHGDYTATLAERSEFSIRNSIKFVFMWNTAYENNVKLYNVSSNWVQSRFHPDVHNIPAEYRRPELGNIIMSLVNLNPDVFPLEMPNLEKIEIRRASESRVELLPDLARPNWPALKILEIKIDCKMAKQLRRMRHLGIVQWYYTDADIVATHTEHLFHFFFRGIERPSLQELRLDFLETDENLPVPNTNDIVNACPNLKKLTIVRWPGTNKALTKLWGGLPNLEEICLENCPGLGNVAFVGENKNDPVFLELKKLKRLSLKGLDKWPKITDTLFSLVIRHLSLTHFVVTSDVPLQSVTMKGIEYLLDGSFCKSIENFPFDVWSLAYVTSAEWNEIERKFRSFNMV